MDRRYDTSRQLLFGLLALQTGLIDQSALVAAFHAWTQDKARPLADQLIILGRLDATHRPLLEGLAEAHLAGHGGDPEKSLAAIPAGISTREKLARVGDADVEASLTHLRPDSTQAGSEGERTATYSVGAATSEGQRFRVLRPHARGGLGTVFVALDTELHREVALKQILDSHADDPVSRQRFLLEAEVTGGLEHPGIVPVYGLGTYEGGRPFYAMRFIRGDSLKEAIDRFHADEATKNDPGRRSLELRKLLRRFLDVCNAIDYAHSRGVLHRDIKPGNVIVGRHGETLVVDWGLAKATGLADPGAGERTLRPSSASGSAETLSGSALGTPAYMSPEQAQGDLEHLGPRSDVYSLGATLYCLLTGEPPFTGDAVDVIPRVQRGDFRPPRAVDPAIDPALEGICLKAMALKPQDRYGSCRALAEDVERWMADEPVSAWREPLARQAGRWARRNRTAVAAAAVAVVAGAVGLAGVLAVQTQAKADLAQSLARETRANKALAESNDELDRSRAAVQARYDLAVEAIKTFHTGVSEDFLLKEDKFKDLRERLLKSAGSFYEKLGALLKEEADLPARRALLQANYELAVLADLLGRKEDALAMHRKVLAGREALAGDPATSTGSRVDVARSLLSVGELLDATGKGTEALTSYDWARAAVSGPDGATPADPAARSALAASEYARGRLLQSQGKTAEGLATLRHARDLQDDLADADPGNNELKRERARIYSAIGFALLNLDNPEPEAALTAYNAALSIRQKLHDDNPAATNSRRDLAMGHYNLGALLLQTGKMSEAATECRKSLAIIQKLVEDNPAVTRFRSDLGNCHNVLGQALGWWDKRPEAETEYRRAQALFLKLTEENPRATQFLQGIWASHYYLNVLLNKMGRQAEEKAEHRKMVTIFEKLAVDNPAVPEFRGVLAGIHSLLGTRLLDSGESPEAEVEIRKAISVSHAKRRVRPIVMPDLLTAYTGSRPGWFGRGHLRSLRQVTRYRSS
jgi:serine/threonine-protein kinase